jgi:hypothetical protein
MPPHMTTAPAGDRGGGGKDDRQAARRDARKHKPCRYRTQASLKEVVEAADEMARRFVYVCRCPNCAELLIVPKRPIAVALPGECS